MIGTAADAAVSWFWWQPWGGRGKPTQAHYRALRRHLTGKPHYFKDEMVSNLSDEELILLHDWHHFKRGDKNPMTKTKDGKKLTKPKV